MRYICFVRANADWNVKLVNNGEHYHQRRVYMCVYVHFCIYVVCILMYGCVCVNMSAHIHLR